MARDDTEHVEEQGVVRGPARRVPPACTAGVLRDPQPQQRPTTSAARS
ncbi:hypothetical protein [Streptomyces sp. NPDC003032]